MPWTLSLVTDEMVAVVGADRGRAVGEGVEEADGVGLVHEFGDLGWGEPAERGGFTGLWGGGAAGDATAEDQREARGNGRTCPPRSCRTSRPSGASMAQPGSLDL
jgi:hypothetical protein